MGFLKKIFKGIKKVVKKIGKGIKKVAKGLSKAFGKLGILGQIGLMFIPGVGQILSGMLGTMGAGVANFVSTTFGAVGKAAVGGFKAIMGGVKAAAGAMGKVFGTVTDAVMGGVNWITNTVSGGKFKTLGNVFDGFAGWVQDTGKKIFGTPTTSDVVSDAIVPDIIAGPGKGEIKSKLISELPVDASLLSPSTPTYSSVDQSILAKMDKYSGTEGGLDLKDTLYGQLSPEGKDIFDSSEGKAIVEEVAVSSVEDAAKNANSTWDKIVTKGKEELLTGVTSGIQQKGRELVTGKPPTPNYVNNYVPDWMSEMSAFDSNVVNSTDFALQQKGGMYGSNGETIASFGQEFSRNFMQDDPYKTVMASLATPSSLPSGG